MMETSRGFEPHSLQNFLWVSLLSSLALWAGPHVCHVTSLPEMSNLVGRFAFFLEVGGSFLKRISSSLTTE
ncbi:hypothetical protein M432DRAFT_620501 [Thermoascus aurantiacus ATCC 26904]